MQPEALQEVFQLWKLPPGRVLQRGMPETTFQDPQNGTYTVPTFNHAGFWLEPRLHAHTHTHTGF
jgi:hypothetical protein